MNTEKEKQHYVPQFYLRCFSFNSNKKQIGIFITEKEFYYKSSTLKDQACRSFYYGKDGEIEDALSEIEGYHASILNKILDSNYIPTKNSMDHVELLHFLLLTEFRNPISKEYINKSLENLRQIIKKKYGDRVDSDVEEISHDEAVKMSLGRVMTGVKICGDLQIKIIINKTNHPFVTSDNPLIKYNQYLEIKNHNRGTRGFGNMGIQMFLPISSKKMIIIFDPWCYKIGSARKNIVETNNPQDVDQLNKLQFLNCSATVFFNHECDKNYITDIFLKSKKFTKANIASTKELGFEASEKKDNSSLIMTMPSEMKTKLNLSFAKLSDSAKFKKVDPNMSLIRPFSSMIMK